MFMNLKELFDEVKDEPLPFQWKWLIDRLYENISLKELVATELRLFLCIVVVGGMEDDGIPIEQDDIDQLYENVERIVKTKIAKLN